MQGRQPFVRNPADNALLGGVIADGFDGTAFQASLQSFSSSGVAGCLKTKITAVVVAAKVARSGFAAKITIDNTGYRRKIYREGFRG